MPVMRYLAVTIGSDTGGRIALSFGIGGKGFATGVVYLLLRKKRSYSKPVQNQKGAKSRRMTLL